MSLVIVCISIINLLCVSFSSINFPSVTYLRFISSFLSTSIIISLLLFLLLFYPLRHPLPHPASGNNQKAGTTKRQVIFNGVVTASSLRDVLSCAWKVAGMYGRSRTGRLVLEAEPRARGSDGVPCVAGSKEV